MFVDDLDICRKLVHGYVLLKYYTVKYEVERDNFLSGAYSEIDYITGKRVSISVEDLAITLIDHEERFERKVKQYRRESNIFHEALSHLNESETNNFYYAINHESEIHNHKELQLVIMEVGQYVEMNHHTDINVKHQEARQQAINTIKGELKHDKNNNRKNESTSYGA